MIMMIIFFIIPADSAAGVIDIRDGQYNLRIVSWYFNEMFNEDIFDNTDTKF